MESTLNHIKSIINQQEPVWIGLREKIHANPELSFQEFNTQQLVIKTLQSWGIESHVIGKTGVVGLIHGSRVGKCVALRSELDALPIQEQNQVEYASQNAGVMHACGHDVHTACLLGAAYVLKQTAEHWSGTIKLVFQPGEEKLPGGASVLIQEGVLESPKVDYMIAQHVAPELPVGSLGFRQGMYMASCDEIYITVQGKGGHGALPHTVIDPVLTSAHIVVALQSLISRFSKATTPSVLSFGKIQGLGATNVIPDQVTLEGTFRTFDEAWRIQAHEKIITLCEHQAKSMGASAEVRIEKGYPFLYNDPFFTKRCQESAEATFEKRAIHQLDLRMTSEDFSFYSQKVPCCFYRLGVQSPNGQEVKQVHTPVFDIDQKAIASGVLALSSLALEALRD